MKNLLKNFCYTAVVVSLLTSNILINVQAQPKKDNIPIEKKLTICHYPPGNPDNVQRIEINDNSLETHLKHEDYIPKDNEECKVKESTKPEILIPNEPQTAPESVNPTTNEPAILEVTQNAQPKTQNIQLETQPAQTTALTEPIDPVIYSYAKPVFRFFNIQGAPRHFYTINTTEFQDLLKLTNEWKYEGIAYYAWTDYTDLITEKITCFNDKVPVYRFFSENKSNHIYTIDNSEANSLLADPNYGYEGIKFCVYRTDSKNGIDPVHRFWHDINDKHFYSINRKEIADLVTAYTEGTNNWRPEGVKFYAIKALNFYDYSFDSSVITNNNKKIEESDFMCGGYKYVIYQNSSQKIQTEDYVFNPAKNSFFSIMVENYFTAAYYEIGDHCSLLGLPTMDKTEAVSSPTGNTGEYQLYDKGGIYYNRKNDSTFAVYGKIFVMYEEDEGGTGGNYGFPTDSQRWYAEKNSVCQMFEGGLICEEVNTEPQPIDLDKDGLDDNLENELMYKYAPVLYLDKDEKYFPASVDWLYGKASLNVYNGDEKCSSSFGEFNSQSNLVDKSTNFMDYYKSGYPVPYSIFFGSSCVKSEDVDGIEKKLSSISQENYDNDHYFYLNIDNNSLKGTENMSDWAIYGHIFPAKNNEIHIQYWYFFPNNDPKSKFTVGLGNHEGDWEHITVVLKDMNPSKVYYAYHTHNNPGAEYCWSECEKSINKYETHPIVIVASGSHASYISEAEADSLSEIFNYGGSFSFTWRESRLENLGEHTSNPSTSFSPFIRFAGKWGETRFNSGDILPTYSPDTLSFQEGWNSNRY